MSSPSMFQGGADKAAMRRLLPWISLGVILALLCVLPFELKPYHREITIFFIINLIMVSSYRLITTTGDWSFSHVVLMGAGAYGAALIAKHSGLPFIVVVPMAGICAAVVGLMFITPLLRVAGFGFFIASYALGELVRLLWLKLQFPFGGTRGIINIPSPELFGLRLSPSINYYFTCLIVMLIAMFIMYRLDKSRIGNAWKSIHSDPTLAECVGISVDRYRTLAFVTGAFFAGIAGSLLAYHLGAIDPRNFDLTQMTYLLIWVVVGGTATFWGPIAGLIVITIAFEWSRPLLEWRPMMFGALLIFFLVFLPGGLESLWPKVGPALRQPPGAHFSRFRIWLTTFVART
ncbi:MAG: branched-chain amino acid ABC transporter permease [Rhodospirillaceae bacterium]|nr:branched-chain amino acid ABC transporter permease [Rhodospirillaceae bacterium]MBT7293546.1 branched-chain amino acid ABC transporter permease [Rhodospirillaceae bacterium]